MEERGALNSRVKTGTMGLESAITTLPSGGNNSALGTLASSGGLFTRILDIFGFFSILKIFLDY